MDFMRGPKRVTIINEGKWENEDPVREIFYKLLVGLCSSSTPAEGH